jgi:[CysO sulfur-carrier protein]-S-L-cysteine hydrolase
MRISHVQYKEMVAHADETAPNECCGYLCITEGTVEAVYRAQNLRNSPYGYELDGPSLLAANELDEQGYEVSIYHSHPRSEAEPSQTDINLAYYPHWRYVIITLKGEPHIRAWRIADGDVTEEEVIVS